MQKREEMPPLGPIFEEDYNCVYPSQPKLFADVRKRNKSKKRVDMFSDEDDEERKAAELSQPSSPVDLTASSRCPEEVYLKTRNGTQEMSSTCSSAMCETKACEEAFESAANTNITSAAMQAKRGLAFSVENILDPNKFTGGRAILQDCRRHRSGSVNEGEAKVEESIFN